MKKMLLIFLLVLSTVFVGCGNMNFGFGNYTYNGVHIETYHNTVCYTVETWTNAETGIEVKTKEIGSIFLSEGTYILFETECPICSKNVNSAE